MRSSLDSLPVGFTAQGLDLMRSSPRGTDGRSKVQFGNEKNDYLFTAAESVRTATDKYGDLSEQRASILPHVGRLGTALLNFV